MRKKLIAANWKMNTSLAEAHVLADGVRTGAEHIERIDIVLFPPTIWLSELSHNIQPGGHLPHLGLGGQNIYPESKGAFTGETAPAMLKSLADWVLVGHSERTHLFGEAPELTAKKLRTAFRAGLRPILCIGEDAKGQTEDLAARLLALTADLQRDQLATLVVAYEPVWAISGTVGHEPATGEYAQTVAAALRRELTPDTRILYGGSATDANARDFLGQPDIDGLLVGGASLDLKKFLTICQIADDLS